MKKIIVCLAALTVLFTASAQQPGMPQKTINVTGTAELEVVPDEIYVQVELQEYEKKGAGKINIDKIKNDFLVACKSIGLTEKEVSVQSYSGSDGNYWWYKKNKKQNPDLKASIVYSVKLADVHKLDELVDKLDDEATQSFNITKFSHSRLEEYKKELKVKAAKDAREKAVTLAAALDEQVGGAVSISDATEINYAPLPRSVMDLRFYKKSSGDSDTETIDPAFKKIKLQFNVNVTFALK